MASEFSKEQLERILSTVMGEDEDDHEQDMGELGMFVGTIFNDGFTAAAEQFSSVVEHAKTCDECLRDAEAIFGHLLFDKVRIGLGTSSIAE